MNNSATFIDNTTLYRVITGAISDLVTDTVNRNSTTSTCYQLMIGTAVALTGALVLLFDLHLSSTNARFDFYVVRLTLTPLS